MSETTEEMRIVAEASRLIGMTITESDVLRRGDRNLVILGRVDDSSDVIIKAVVGAKNLLSPESAALRRLERASTSVRFAPRLLAYDEQAGIEVIEAIENARPLDDFLNGTDRPRASRILETTAHRLGQLHAETSKTVEPTDTSLSVEQSAAFVRMEADIRKFYERAGVEWLIDGSAEIVQIAQELKNPGSLRAFTVGDMAPSNVLVQGEEVFFIDFEYAGFRHAFYDAVFWHAICPFPDEVVETMDQSYQRGWAEAGLPLDEQHFADSMALLAGYRALWSLTWGTMSLWDKNYDMMPGISGRRLVRSWLRGFYRFAQKGQMIPQLVEATQQLDHALGEHWPESEEAVRFPVFEEKG